MYVSTVAIFGGDPMPIPSPHPSPPHRPPLPLLWPSPTPISYTHLLHHLVHPSCDATLIPYSRCQPPHGPLWYAGIGSIGPQNFLEYGVLSGMLLIGGVVNKDPNRGGSEHRIRKGTDARPLPTTLARTPAHSSADKEIGTHTPNTLLSVSTLIAPHPRSRGRL